MENIFAFAFGTFRNLLRARKVSVFVSKAKQVRNKLCDNHIAIDFVSRQ